MRQLRHLRHHPPRLKGSGTATDNNISRHIFARCGKWAIIFLNTKNEANGNLYVDMPKDFQGFFEGDSKQFLNLAAWREAHGWDKNSVVADAHIDFDPDTLQLTISMSEPFLKAPAVNQIEVDILGKLTSGARVPGPLADPGARSPGSLIPATRSGDQKSQEWNTPFWGAVITGNRDSQLLRLAS